MDQGVLLFWSETAAYYGKQVEDTVVKMYAKETQHLNEASLRSALKAHKMSNQGHFFPLPCVLLKHLESTPANNPDLVVSNIYQAIRDYGYPNGDKAQRALSTIEWNTVSAMGGWYTLCTNPNQTPDSIIRSQMKGAAESQISLSQHTMESIGHTEKKEGRSGELEKKTLQGLSDFL